METLGDFENDNPKFIFSSVFLKNFPFKKTTNSGLIVLSSFSVSSVSSFEEEEEEREEELEEERVEEAEKGEEEEVDEGDELIFGDVELVGEGVVAILFGLVAFLIEGAEEEVASAFVVLERVFVAVTGFAVVDILLGDFGNDNPKFIFFSILKNFPFEKTVNSGLIVSSSSSVSSVSSFEEEEEEREEEELEEEREEEADKGEEEEREEEEVEEGEEGESEGVVAILFGLIAFLMVAFPLEGAEEEAALAFVVLARVFVADIFGEDGVGVVSFALPFVFSASSCSFPSVYCGRKVESSIFLS
jgi:hypothetical protein